MAWTDERLDDFAGQTAAGFERVESEIRDLRSEIRDLRSEIRDIRVEMRTGSDALRQELKGDIDSLRTLTIRFGAALMIAMAGMIATLIGIAATGSLG